MLRSTLISAIAFLSCSVFAQQLGDFVFTENDSSVIQQKYSSDQLGFLIYQLHSEIGEKTISTSESSVQEDALLLLASIKELSDYSVITAMQHSQNKAEIFDAYIDAMESILYKSTAIQSQLQSEIKFISTNIQVCNTQQEASIDAYQKAIDFSSNQNIDSIVMESQKNAACVASSTSLLTSKQTLLDLLIDASNILGERYDYLSSQKELILNYFDLLNSNYLQQVLDVQEDIKNAGY